MSAYDQIPERALQEQGKASDRAHPELAAMSREELDARTAHLPRAMRRSVVRDWRAAQRKASTRTPRPRT